jgi:hypothetical protein
MKTFLKSLVLLVILSAAASANRTVYHDTLVNETALTKDTNYSLDLNQQGIDLVSAQAVYSTATISAVTFDDGRKSTATITVSSNTALSGRRLTIGSVVLIEGRDWTKQATASATARSISDAIMANSTLSAVMVSTWAVGGVVYATSTVPGTALHSYDMVSSTPAALTITTFRAGLNPDVSLSADTITATNHRFTTALPVLFTASAGTPPTGLTANTTYYVVKVNNNDFKLSATSTGAVAGASVNITALTGEGTFSLATLAYTGTASWAWEGSNDGTNFNQLAISSITYSSPSGTTSTIWDFGRLNFRYLRLAVIAPTTGGLRLAVTVNGKKEE